MNNQICTPATARRLKEQGFKQPLPAPGQVWYDLVKNPNLPCFIHRAKEGWYWDNHGNSYTAEAFTEDGCYAPTAPDILRELGSRFALTIHPEAIGGNCFCMQFMPAAITTVRVHAEWQHDNPAEACAEAWEAKQKRG